MTYSLNSYRERRTNYSFWPVEDSLLGKPVYMFDIFNLDSFPQKVNTGIGTLGYRYDSPFVSLAKVQLLPSEKNYRMRAGQRLVMTCAAAMPPYYWNFIKTHPGIDAEIFLSFFNKGQWVQNISLPRTIYQLSPNDFYVDVYPALPPGQYFMIFSIYVAGTITSPINSQKIKLIVE